MSIHPFLFSSVSTLFVSPAKTLRSVKITWEKEDGCTCIDVGKEKLEEVLFTIEALNGKDATRACPINARNINIVIGANVHPFRITRVHINNANLSNNI
jgi:hypothetical protein